MNEGFCCITNKGKAAKSEWENEESNILWALFRVCKKRRQFFFHTYSLTCLKQGYFSSGKSCKYLKKFIS